MKRDLKVLDPINDLAERFSWVMLVNTASLGIQRILMEKSGQFLALELGPDFSEKVEKCRETHALPEERLLKLG